MIALALTLTALPVPAQQTETMKVRPSTEAEAVTEFEETCVAGLYDPGALTRAAAASRRGYAFEDSGNPAQWRNWISSYGTIHYLAHSRETSPRCNFTSFTRAPVDRDALDAALRAMAKRRSARGYFEGRGVRGLFWSWYNRAGEGMTVDVLLDRRTPQQIVLMLKPYAVEK